jgi:hypothetical protein
MRAASHLLQITDNAVLTDSCQIIISCSRGRSVIQLIVHICVLGSRYRMKMSIVFTLSEQNISDLAFAIALYNIIAPLINMVCYCS